MAVLPEDFEIKIGVEYQKLVGFMTEFFEGVRIEINRLRPLIEIYSGVRRQQVRLVRTQYRRKQKARARRNRRRR